ncbi:MAG: DEAD/DEAH box helicase family protein [Alphaproteobacteria bacterium]|nr:DEAD/DEAH box helicase family protein [Alphaproteobacteria bacterium]
MAKINIKTSKKVIPMCYAYTTPQIASHEGWTKIGFTEQDVETRVRQQTQTADIEYKIEWKANAIYDDGSGDIFHDTDFHCYLKKIGIERKIGTEWFHILPQTSKQRFDEFRANRGIAQTDVVIEYKLRTEQQKAVQQAKSYFQQYADDEPEFLWNAKPRFGKTLSAYDLCKQLDAKTVLIVTHRPAIATSWYSDYEKFFGTQSGYFFVSQVDTLKNKPCVVKRENLPPSARKYIEFISLQDLKGAIDFGGKYDKLKHIAQLKWDLLIIDESHEGIDTYRADIAFDNIKRKYTLHLSGTPFRALANSKFEEKAVYNWTYADEQKAKKEWDETKEEENPYSTLPQLNLYTYQMSEIIRDKLQKGADFDDDGETESYAFDLNEFFITNSNGSFKYDADVDKFLEALTTQAKFPFSTEELRNELRHTFWLLNRVDSAKALAKKLKEHPIFREYEIVLVAGDGNLDEDTENQKSFDKVVKAIKENDKTITISVGQLTTGVTVPEWTAVLMLSNVKSPALYMQAAFRAQNPCLFKYGQLQFRKENAYVFDFDPARTLVVFEQFANDLNTTTSAGKGNIDERKQNIRELINFFPVYGEDDEGEMITLDAEKILTIPRKIYAKEVVRKGFMCNFLFQNISNIFNAPKEVIDIIQNFTPQKEPIGVTYETKDKLNINTEGEIELSSEMVIGKAADIFGEKLYNNIEDELVKTVETIKDEIQSKKEVDEIKEDLKEKFHIGTSAMIEIAKKEYGKDLSKSAQKKLVQTLNADAERTFEKQFGSYKIDIERLERDRKIEIKQAKNEKEIAAINQKFDTTKSVVENNLAETLKNSINQVVHEAGKTIVEITETDIKQREKQSIEEGVRDHLRGFSRTIPSFLMAYGDENTTLENFDTIIPNEVFKEVTSITLDEFRFLRDGGDYVDDKTGETKHYAGNLFDPVVFNDSVKEFLNLRTKLSNYFDEEQIEDIFDYIPPQKTNQIYTPKKVVKEMVDNLEKECPECFENSDRTFIDLYMKSGLYITEIVKRLFNSSNLKQKYPNEQERLEHIFANQVYGLAPTEIIYRIATAYILGFDEKMSIDKHNLRLFDTLPSVQKGTLEKDLDKVFK